MISCGAGDGIIKVWDLRRNYKTYRGDLLPLHTMPHPGKSTLKGFTNLLIDNCGKNLYASSMNNQIYCYDVSSFSPNPKKYVGSRIGTFYVKSCLSPDNLYLISGSSDGKAYIWNLKNSEPLVVLKGHEAEVTCVAWSSTPETCLVTCSDDAKHKIWRIGPEEINDNDKMSAFTGFGDLYIKNCSSDTNESEMFDPLLHTPITIRMNIEGNETTPSTSDRTSTEIENEIADGINRNDNRRSRPGGTLFLSNRNFNTDDSPKTPKVSAEPTAYSPPPGPSYSQSFFNVLPRRIASTSNIPIAKGFPSPTLNLPNFVLDGDAPHLSVISPKREAKENVDWLTKIRKRKLSTGRFSIKDKLSQCDDDYQDAEPETTITTKTHFSSPSSSRNFEASNMIPGTPKSRINSGRTASSDMTLRHHNQQQKTGSTTPTTSRRNTETILKYLTISSPPSSSKTKQPVNLNEKSGEKETGTTSSSSSEN